MGDGKMQRECLLETAGKRENEVGTTSGDTFETEKMKPDRLSKTPRKREDEAGTPPIGDGKMQRERLPEMTRQSKIGAGTPLRNASEIRK